MISESQIDFLDAQLSKSQINDKILRDDLLDHLSCIVEEKLSQGMNFESAYNTAVHQLAPNGLREIQREVVFMVNRRRIVTVRRLIFLSGYLFFLLSMTGLFFTKMHWPGATQLLITGLSGLVFVFAPMLVLNKFTHLNGRLISITAGWILGAVITGSAISFLVVEILGITGFGVVVSCFFFIIGFILLPVQFLRMYRKSMKLT